MERLRAPAGRGGGAAEVGEGWGGEGGGRGEGFQGAGRRGGGDGGDGCGGGGRASARALADDDCAAREAWCFRSDRIWGRLGSLGGSTSACEGVSVLMRRGAGGRERFIRVAQVSQTRRGPAAAAGHHSHHGRRVTRLAGEEAQPYVRKHHRGRAGIPIAARARCGISAFASLSHTSLPPRKADSDGRREAARNACESCCNPPRDADLWLPMEKDVCDGGTASTSLHKAARHGDAGVVAKSLECTSLNIDAVDGDGHTALMIAALNGNAAVANALCAAGCDVDALDAVGRSAEQLAAESGHSELAASLASEKAKRAALWDAIRGVGDVAAPVAAAAAAKPPTIEELIAGGGGVPKTGGVAECPF